MFFKNLELTRKVSLLLLNAPGKCVANLIYAVIFFNQQSNLNGIEKLDQTNMLNF